MNNEFIPKLELKMNMNTDIKIFEQGKGEIMIPSTEEKQGYQILIELLKELREIPEAKELMDKYNIQFK